MGGGGLCSPLRKFWSANLPPHVTEGASPRSASAFFSAWVIFSSYISLLHIIIISRNTTSAYCVVILGNIIFKIFISFGAE